MKKISGAHLWRGTQAERQMERRVEGHKKVGEKSTRVKFSEAHGQKSQEARGKRGRQAERHTGIGADRHSSTRYEKHTGTGAGGQRGTVPERHTGKGAHGYKGRGNPEVRGAHEHRSREARGQMGTRANG
jgi:hypothetical protein